MNFRLLPIFAACCFLSITFLPVQSAAQIPSNSSDVKLTLTECEGDNCATWKFVGTLGTGKWRNGYEGTLNMTKDGDRILIHRADTTGLSEGLVADYTGMLKGKGTKDLRISGEFTSSWKGEKKTGDWFAHLDVAHESTPGVIRQCLTPANSYCWTLTWNRDHYDGVVDNGPNKATIKITAENGGPADLRAGQTVTMRGQQNLAGGRVYTSQSTGTVSGEGNRIQDGHWSDSNGASGSFDAAWGTAIKSLPLGRYPVSQPQAVWAPDPLAWEIAERLVLAWLKSSN